MNALSFQTEVARYLTNKRYRDEARKAAAETSTCETASTLQFAATELDVNRADMFARLLVANRLSKAVKGLPWTTTLLGGELNGIGNEFNAAIPPQHSRIFEEASAFAHYLLSRCEHREPSCPILPDIIRYELNALELRFQFDGHFTTEEGECLDSIVSGSVLDSVDASVRPFRLNHNRIVAFSYDVAGIGELIKSGQLDLAVAFDRSPRLVLFYMKPTGELGNDEINSATQYFIRLCDGTRSLAEVIAATADQDPNGCAECPDDLIGECAVLFASLVERCVLGYRNC